LWGNNQENETTYAYDNALTFRGPYWVSATQFSPISGTYSGSYGLLQTKKDYDYGNGAPGTTVLRTTSTSYEALLNSGYLNNNLLTLPAGVSVTGSGPGSITSYAYDQTTPVVSGITTQHDSNPPAGTYRGNPTTVSRYVNTTGTYVNTTSTNFDTGMVDIVKDPNGNQTQYGYSGTYAGAFLTSVANALNQTTAFAYDFNTGLPTSTTDPNNQTTSYGYDNMLRTTQINHPDGGHTYLTYDSSFQGGAYTLIQEQMDTAGAGRSSYVWVDGLGREGRVATSSGETLPEDETVDICYDSLGRVSFQGYAFQDGGWGTSRSCSIAGDSFTYDALGRGTKVTHSDNSFISTSYSGNSATVTDEAGKTRESFTDGLGRMTEVIENPGGLNYITNYTYDALDNLTGVVESGSRNRSFVYDSLSRLTSSTNPESGTQSFGYDADSNLKTRVAPAPNQTGTGTVTTTYSYDALNRITQKSYSDGSTPSVFFGYDANFWWGVTLTNTIGRLMTQWVGTSCCVTTGEEIFSYDPMGRILLNTQYVQSTQTFTQMTYTYDLVGDMLTATKQGGYTTSYQYNSAGRPTTMTSSLVDAQHPATLASGVHYAANGAMTQLTYGNGLTESTVYNPRFQPCRNNVNSSGTVFNNVSACGSTSMPTGNVLDLQYNWNPGSGDNGNLAGTTVAGAQTYSRTYSYDQLNRLSSMSGTGGLCTGLNWSYDAWGNRTSQTQVSGTCYQQPTTTITSKNQFSGYGYDAAGNMTSQSGATYAYDAENRLTSTSGGSASYLYDATGRRVTKTVSGAYRNYLYDLNRNVISEATSAGWATGYVYLNGRPIAEYANATTYFLTGDHLGSSRLLTSLSKGVQDCNGLYPYGEQDPGICTSTNTTPHKFTGYERDAESGLDNAQARYYGSSLGRFTSPDPYNAGADPGSPQSWNMYAYVLNNPLRFIDPTGLDCVYLANDGSTSTAINNSVGAPDGSPEGGASIDHNSSAGECHGTDGDWIEGTVGSLNDISTDPNSNWVSGINTSGAKSVDCEGSEGECSSAAFAAFQGNTTTVVVNGSAVALTPYQVGIFGGVYQQTYGFNKVVTCGSSIVYPLLPAPNPDDLSGAILDNGSHGVEAAAGAAESAANRIKGAARIGPSRLGRIAKLERQAKMASRTAKVLGAAGYAMAAPEVIKNYQENCR
jgi:RHS repeat-associated protein